MRKKSRFEKEVAKDEKEIEKINKMIDKKQAKEVGNWLKRWAKEGFFWRGKYFHQKSKKGDWL